MSRQEHHYSVQDVINAIQNGSVMWTWTLMTLMKSQMKNPEEYWTEKTNHPLTAQPMKTLSPSWPHLPRPMPRTRKKYFTRPNTDFSEKSGPPLTEDVTTQRTLLEYFRQFVSKDMIQSLASNTNIQYRPPWKKKCFVFHLFK